MLLGTANHQLFAQQMTSQAPPPRTSIIAPDAVQNRIQKTLPEEAPRVELPDTPSQIAYPVAKALVEPAASDLVHIESSGPQTYLHGVYTLNQDVVLTYKDRRVQADHIEYDENTGQLTLTGRVLVMGGSRERIAASHGDYNLQTETGRFYDVSGSYGFQRTAKERRTVYTTDNPFLFTGRVVVKSGPMAYDVYDGTVTSCQLEHPDWVLSAAHISVDGEIAKARNSTFRLLNVPILFLPYVTHPADAEARQTGLLIPTVGLSNQKGLILGEEVYVALSRSLDLRVGADYYSSIGWAQKGTLRYRGAGLDFATLHYSGVMDRRSSNLQQGGQEVVLAARHDLDQYTRVAANLDYLSSYIFREAFSDTFNQAVTSDIVSTAYVVHEQHGIEIGGLFDRYQGIKVLSSTPQQQVHLFHAPTVLFDTTEHVIARTASPVSSGLELSVEVSSSGLKRTQPNFATGGIIERLDLHPQVSYPLSFADWHVVPSLAVRETLYSRSRVTPARGVPPTQDNASLSRSDVEFTLAVRAPVLERSFKPTRFNRILGNELRHTIAPELTYRLTSGVASFSNILRFDPTDIVSNTNEAEYGVTQRVYRRQARANQVAADSACDATAVAKLPGFNSDAPNTQDEVARVEEGPVAGNCPSEELISWRLTQRYFFDQNFGGAVVTGRRNIFATTLDLSGVAFMTEPREISPLISRLRVRLSSHTDFEWDFDLDTGAKKFNSSNVYLDLHQKGAFTAVSYARLDAPGRFFIENPDSTTLPVGVTSLVSDFNQLRLLAGYGNPGKPGLSVAANAGIDLKHLYGATRVGVTGTAQNTIYPPLLQQASVQASYNWNCCGLAIEYRKLELGSVRNDGTYRFNFTLANIGAAGNLRRAERLF
jgi:LPS-assembly protein